MAFLEDVIAHLVGTTGMTSADSTVGGLFAALFQGLPGGMNSTGIGGLPALIARFETMGLGAIIHSWTGPGHNLPVTPEQLRAVLGEGAVKAIAEEAGRTEEDVLVELSMMLPGVVDRMTHGHATDGLTA